MTGTERTLPADTKSLEQRIEAAISRLRTRGDNAYCDYISQSGRPECLGWEVKVERDTFGWPELEAHTRRGELLGRNRALYEAAKLIEEELKS